MKRIIILAASAAALCLVSCGRNSAGQPEAVTGNAVIDAIMNRRSIRMYKDMPVEREKLRLIADPTP